MEDTGRRGSIWDGAGGSKIGNQKIDNSMTDSAEIKAEGEYQ
jgi:hypothetical protein